MSDRDMQEIAKLFRDLKFKKKLFGGVDERDVWRKLDKVQKEYRSLYEAREIKYRTILQAAGIPENIIARLADETEHHE